MADEMKYEQLKTRRGEEDGGARFCPRKKSLIGRLVRLADEMPYEPLNTRRGEEEGGARFCSRKRRWRRNLPAGEVPVFVGLTMERFSVPAELLGRPLFLELLRLSAEEYGYEQSGVIRIPCSILLFCRVLRYLSAADSDEGRNPTVESEADILRSLEEEL
ncbi:hypothetical protein HPP92_019003 [Vanilla planifolia]|uniref:Small auxin up regulated protein n=1 Tax=Vanilla planifolia TaxID=51239 RepID=A0A835Q392_VANPL|nr:hypothetical protein HPP92_019003 [Vanilla planifolia]